MDYIKTFTAKVKTPQGDKFISGAAVIEGVLVGVTFKNKRKDGSWNIAYKPYFNSSLITPSIKSEIQKIGTNFTLEQIAKYKEYMFVPGENPNGYFVEEVKKTYPNYAGQTQTCWECGCEFTYAQCKRDGGDWKESYCGC